MKLSLVLPAALAVVFAAKAASAENVCIDDKAKQALACSGATAKEIDASALRAGPGFRGVAPPAKPTSTTKPPAPTDEAPRDVRAIRLAPRAKNLLVTQIQQLAQLFSTTKKNAPDRPQIARRLADTYVELESLAFREMVQAQMKRDALKKTDPKAAGLEQTKANEAEKVMKAARKQAIETYTIFVTDYPTHASIDEVLYYLAYEYEQAGDMKNARATYYDLIKKAPQSHYVPNAYLAFGELFFNEAQGDPTKWDLAAQAYTEVVKYVAPQNKVQGYAFYKLAYVHWNKGEFEKALDAFKKTIEVGVANSTLPGATKLAESARRDTIPVYALKGDPKMAFGFLKNISGDAAGSNEKTFKLMDDLGNAYLDTGHYPEGVLVYKDLLSRDRGGRSCGYQARITDAVMAMRSADKDAIKAELENQLRVYAENKSSNADAEAKKTCASRTAALVTETAMAWHLEAVGGSPTQRGTNDKRTMALAAALYKRAADTWTKEDFASFQFPRLVKEDWPTLFKIKYAMADLLYENRDWKACGPAFDAVVKEDPKGPEAPKAAYAAGLCYQAAYEEAHKNNSGRRGVGQLTGTTTSASIARQLEPKEMSAEQKAMVGAFDRYVCLVKPPANDTAAQEQLVEVKYARARTYFEAQRWEEAAALFKDIALSHPASESSIYAAQLYLEAANVMNKHFGKPSCEEDMSNDMPKLMELHCTGDRAQRNADQCQTLRVVSVDLLRLRAQRFVEKADTLQSGSKEALALYEQGGSSYFELFRKYCQDPVASNAKPQAEHCDEIAYNAAKAFQAARLLAKAITVRRALLTFDERVHERSVLAKKATYEIGANYQAIAVYDQAAEWFEKYARSDKQAENADRALSDAVLLRLGLGQEAEAIKDAEDFMKTYGAKAPAQAGAVAYAIGAHYAEKEEWEKARAALAGAERTIDRAAPDIQLQTHATLGRAHSKLGSTHAAKARSEYAKVRGMWSDPAAAEKKIRSAYPAEDDAQKDRRVARALLAVGEAFFFAAEEKKNAEVDVLRFPEYKGPGDKASVKAHIETKVKDWYVKKEAAIARAAAEYAKVLDLKPAPPPRWVIAAGSRVGLMWGDFVDDFRRAPIPKAWKGTDLEIVYTNGIDSASEPYKTNKAKPALKSCLDLSTKYQYFDSYSRSCEAWLAKNYKDEYHIVDELRGAPTLANSGLEEKAPPVLVSGSFFHPTR